MERPAREDWTEDEAMSGDRVKQTTVQWLEEGRAEGLVEGRSRDRQRQIDVMRLMAARKFDEATAEELRGRLQWVVDHDQIGEIGEWLIESEHADEFLDRVKQPSLETIGEVLLKVRLAVQLQRIADPEQMGEVGEWLIECEDARELFDRVEGLTGRWFSSSVAASRTASAPPRL